MSYLAPRESHKGFHFYTSYLDCPRKFYIRYILGIRPEAEAKALIFGKVIHDVLHEAVFGGIIHPDDVVKLFRQKLKAEKLKYPDEEAYQYDLQSGSDLVYSFKQLQNKREVTQEETPLEGEHEYEVPIGPDGIYTMTIRPDYVFEDKERNVLVKDYKTTGWSTSKTLEGVDKDDQMTCYIWGLQKMHPEWKINSGIAEVLYRRGAKHEITKGDPIYRSAYDISSFEVMLTGIISEVSRKKQMLSEKKAPAEFFFPRHGAFCKLFGCDYESICRGNLKHFEEDKKQIPLGFTRDIMEEEK